MTSAAPTGPSVRDPSVRDPSVRDPRVGDVGIRKIAIIGGGMAGLAAAWRLSDQDTEPVEITVYEQGWQLGGKGASGRGVHGRIEEHGLHVWLGYYDNAFRLIREVYAALDRPQAAPDCPIQSWRDAFIPARRVGVEERTGRGWQHWVASFRHTTGEPGDDDAVGGTASVSEFLRRAVGLLADFSSSLLEMRLAAEPQPGPAGVKSQPGPAGAEPQPGPAGAHRQPVPAVVLSGSPRPPAGSWAAGAPGTGRDLGGLLQQAQFATVIAAVEGIRLLGAAVPAGTLDLLADQLDRMRTDLEVVILRGDPSLRRLGELADLVITCCLGIVGDRLLVDPAGFGAIDDLDFREWLAGHGARPSTLDSALIRGMYDLVFAYEGGDRERPRFCAGLGLFLAGKFFFDYHGSLFWQMRAGMGDVVFAPLYQALLARGVRFAFFHTLDRLVLDQDRRQVASLIMTRSRSAADDYQPLIMVGGLPCFRADPDLSQLAEPDSRPVELLAGEDFDTVVLAASLGSLAGPCAELIGESRRWHAMIDNLATVGTQSMQLWLRPSEGELGWDFPASTVSGYLPPFDTYASMTHLLGLEDWPAEDRPTTLGYYCGVLEPDGSGPDVDPARVVAANAAEFLNDHAGHFWPAAVGTQGFDWDLLADGHGSTGGGAARLTSQYIRANTEGSQRYVQSLPGSQRFRLRVDESGCDNLVLAGDWTNCGLNAGCIEAAVISGLEAANAARGLPLMTGVLGTWYGVGS